MKTCGLSFTGDSVLALMTCAQCGTLSPGACPECGSAEKLKSMTRRVEKLRDANEECGWCNGHGYEYIDCGNELSGYDYRQPCRCCIAPARHKPGDIVYAKEALVKAATACWYKADEMLLRGGPGGVREWQWQRPYLSSRFMPRWAARIWREVVEVRAERVQAISEEDAIAEGFTAEALEKALRPREREEEKKYGLPHWMGKHFMGEEDTYCRACAFEKARGLLAAHPREATDAGFDLNDPWILVDGGWVCEVDGPPFCETCGMPLEYTLGCAGSELAEFFHSGAYGHSAYELMRVLKAGDGELNRLAFCYLWDSLHAKRHGGIYVWKENPWVWVYTLKVSSRKAAEGAKKGGAG